MQKRKAGAIRAVVFDLDGTLVDSLADIAAAADATLAHFGRQPHSLTEYRSMVGWGLKQLLVSATAGQPLSEAEFAQAHAALLERYRAHPVVHTVTYPGVGELLAGLAAAGVPAGIVTNKDETTARAIAASLLPGIDRESVLGARPDRPSKPDPAALLQLLAGWGVAPADCAYLGDSGVDMETAARAGAVACGASWGYRPLSDLAGARFVFDRVSGFRDWLPLPAGQTASAIRN